MPRFNYVALDARGKEASGLLEAVSSSAAISQLRQSGYFPTSVIEEAITAPDGKEGRRRAATAERMTKARAKKGIVLFQRRKVKSKILMIFTRQLATLIDSG
jgi:type IV pilus assembly protein PilC